MYNLFLLHTGLINNDRSCPASLGSAFSLLNHGFCNLRNGSLGQEGQIRSDFLIAPCFVSPVKHAWPEEGHGRDALRFDCFFSLQPGKHIAAAVETLNRVGARHHMVLPLLTVSCDRCRTAAAAAADIKQTYMVCSESSDMQRYLAASLTSARVDIT